MKKQVKRGWEVPTLIILTKSADGGEDALAPCKMTNFGHVSAGPNAINTACYHGSDPNLYCTTLCASGQRS
jgi:hypothetical protein